MFKVVKFLAVLTAVSSLGFCADEAEVRAQAFGRLAQAYHNGFSSYHSVVETFSSQEHKVLALKSIDENADKLTRAVAVYPGCTALTELLALVVEDFEVPASAGVTAESSRDAFFQVSGAYHNLINAYNSVDARLAVKTVLENAEHLEFGLSVYPDCQSVRQLIESARTGTLQF